MKRGKTAEMRREAERLCSRITLRFGVCVNCSGPATDAMHVLSKAAFPSVRYLTLNLLPGCRACHEDLRSARLAGPSIMREIFVYVHSENWWYALIAAASKRRPPMSVILKDLMAEAKAKGVV